MDQELEHNVVAERSFWVACGLAIVGGVGPLIAGAGHPNRLASVVVPFLAAAGANAAMALTYRRGRSFTALIYFLGGLAVAYGLLLGLAIPLRLAVEGTCPPAPQTCTNGLELQLSSSETLALSIAVGFGALSLLAGFFGLLVLYRRLGGGTSSGPAVWPQREPEGWRSKEAETGAAKESSPEPEPDKPDETDKPDEPDEKDEPKADSPG